MWRTLSVTAILVGILVFLVSPGVVLAQEGGIGTITPISDTIPAEATITATTIVAIPITTAQNSQRDSATLTPTLLSTVAPTITETVSTAIPSTGTQAIDTLLKDSAAIPGGFKDYKGALLWIFIFGALGGLVYELLRLQGNVEFPHIYRKEENPAEEEYKLAPYAALDKALDLGFLARMFVGGMAAVAILLVVSPTDRIKLLAAAIIAGSAGASIFDTLRSRLAATLAIADAADVRAKAEKMDAKLLELQNQVNQMQQQGRAQLAEAPAAFSAAGAEMQGVATSQTALVTNLSALDDIQRTLSEARGIRSAMDRK